MKEDPATLAENSIFTSPSELQFQATVEEGLRDMNLLIHINPV